MTNGRIFEFKSQVLINLLSLVRTQVRERADGLRYFDVLKEIKVQVRTIKITEMEKRVVHVGQEYQGEL